MCIGTGDSKVADTLVIGGKKKLPVNLADIIQAFNKGLRSIPQFSFEQKVYSLVGYQFSASTGKGKVGGMGLLFPIPVRGKNFNPDLMLNLKEYPNVLKDMAIAYEPRSRGKGVTLGIDRSSAPANYVVNLGDFSILVLTDPSVAAATQLLQDEVPEERWPSDLSALKFAADKYRFKDGESWTILLCCYKQTRDSKRSQPFFAFFEQDPEVVGVYLPGLDKHDDQDPHPGSVSRDHTLMITMPWMNDENSNPVDYVGVPTKLEKILPSHTRGKKEKGEHPNGDWYWDAQPGNLPNTGDSLLAAEDRSVRFSLLPPPQGW